MKIVIQRSKGAQVTVDNEVVGKISHGIVALVCLVEGDDEEKIKKAVHKLANMRIFSDDAGKMNLDIKQTGGEILAISQFTLAWDGQKGHRPSFDQAMAPTRAQVLFKIFLDQLREQVPVQTGRFGAHMKVELENDGPVTFFLEF